ncbi:MAG: glycine oxidase ThiO [Acidobacteriota bacterium]
MSRRHSVIVVGGGVIGSAIAAELASRGTRVALADMRAPGRGATQAAAGALVPFIEGHEGGPLLDLGLRSLARYDEFVDRARRDSRMDVEYARCGSLEVATDQAGAVRLKAAGALLTKFGITNEYLDTAAVRAAEQELSETVTAGLLVPGHGYVVARQLSAALVAAASRLGCEILDAARVTAIDADAGGAVRVLFEDREMTAPHVVLAAGSWAGQVDIAGERLPVRPVRGQLLRLAWPGRLPEGILWSEDCSIVPLRDGTLLAGATSEDAGFDEQPAVAGVRDLLEATCALLPLAWRAGFSEVRTGLRPATRDDLPIVGPSRRVPGLVFAAGHHRNGVLLAPLTAQVVADFILERKADAVLAALGPERFGAL